MFKWIMHKLFKGRPTHHAEECGSATGGVRFHPVNSPLTTKVIESHLNGDCTVGIYLLNESNETRVTCTDFDNLTTNLPNTTITTGLTCP